MYLLLLSQLLFLVASEVASAMSKYSRIFIPHTTKANYQSRELQKLESGLVGRQTSRATRYTNYPPPNAPMAVWAAFGVRY